MRSQLRRTTSCNRCTRCPRYVGNALIAPSTRQDAVLVSLLCACGRRLAAWRGVACHPSPTSSVFSMLSRVRAAADPPVGWGVSQHGFVNSLAFSRSGQVLVAGMGQVRQLDPNDSTCHENMIPTNAGVHLTKGAGLGSRNRGWDAGHGTARRKTGCSFIGFHIATRDLCLVLSPSSGRCREARGDCGLLSMWWCTGSRAPLERIS